MSASSTSSNRIVFVLAAAGALALLVGWLISARRSEPRDVSSAPAESETEPERPAAPEPALRRRSLPPPAPKREEHVADDGVGFMPLHEGAPTEMHHPHRITEQHRRNFAEIRIAAAIDDAMDAQDVPAMKRFLEQYRRDFPEDLGELQGGYAVVIECLERPGPESRAAADRWIDSHNGSTIKRAVLRHCVEPRQS